MDRRLTDHDPRSRAWINNLQGPDFSGGEHYLDNWIDIDNGREVNMEAGWRSGYQDHQISEVSEVTAIRRWIPDQRFERLITIHTGCVKLYCVDT